MWTSLSAWLAHHLREKIAKTLLHLLRDTKELGDELKHLHWQDEMRKGKIDIKDFTCRGGATFPLARLLGAFLG